ncbi:hypothetical protein V5E97_22890 [Singulisphaera sp. Ch08]|uniref:Intracellular proteinase inhibitor BsuPI domain-containing protein n=1 Tax=Singulisphaera sp. Ch08 TaxID=3120278 RepID=A0AAU7C7S7_9BACT
MLEAVTPRRYRLTLRSLMIVVAVCALLLFPLSRSIRELERIRQARLRAVQEAKIARDLGRKSKAEALSLLGLAHAQGTVDSSPGETGTGAERDVVTQQTEISPTDDRWRGKVWAALSVNPPIVRQGETAGLNLEFTLVNDSQQRLAPRIFDSRIVVNGTEVAESPLLRGRLPRIDALAPGEELHFTVPFGRRFEEPGVYRVVWKGPGFRSPEMVIRVLPKRPNGL